MVENETPPRHDAVMTALVIVSIVATGIIIAGLTATPEEPELTVQPTTTTPLPPPPQEEEYILVTPEVAYPTKIPGCDSVEEPVEPVYSSYMSDGLASYDNPIAPWFSGPKAHLMSLALLAALPSDLEFEDGRIPYFDPIPVYEGADFTIDSTNAYGTIGLDDGSGYLSVGVAQFSEEIPPCLAGTLDERRTQSDGTVVDIHTTWQEVNGERTSTRSAIAYLTDGSQVSAYTSAIGDADAVPLSVDELVRIVTYPGLDTSTAPPPGTPGNSMECTPYGTDTTRKLSPDDIETFNRALQQAATGGLAPSPPLGALRTSSWGDGLCQVVNSAAGALTVSVGGAPKPDAPDPDAPVPVSGPYGGGTTISVPTPSGLGITVTTDDSWDPADLERIAMTPGLDIP